MQVTRERSKGSRYFGLYTQVWDDSRDDRISCCAFSRCARVRRVCFSARLWGSVPRRHHIDAARASGAFLWRSIANSPRSRLWRGVPGDP